MSKKKFSKKSLVFYGLILFGLLIDLFFFGHFINETVKFKEENQSLVREIGREQIARAEKTVHAIFQQPISAANEIAALVTKAPGADPTRLIESVSKRYPALFGIGVAYVPYQFQPQLRLFAPYIVREDDGSYRFINIAQVYDYTQFSSEPDTSWYHLPLKKGALWLEPYFGTASKKFLAEYALPIFRPDKTPLGVIVANYSLEDMQDALNSLDIGNTGYAILLSSKGTILAHPDSNAQNQNVVEYHKNTNRLAIAQQAELALENKKVENFVTDASGQEKFIIAREVKGTSWLIELVLDVDELMSYRAHDYQHYVNGIIFSSSVLLILLLLGWLVYRPTIALLYLTSLMISLVLLLTAGTYIFYNSPIIETAETKIFNQSSLNKYLQSTIISKYKGEHFIKIPTGIYIQNMNFANDGKIDLSGFIWQKIPASVNPDQVGQGFVFPQQTAQTYYKKIYEKSLGDFNLFGWQFETSLNINYDNRQFPFGKNLLEIEIAPEKIGENAILVPDLSAYENIKPSALPGVYANLKLKNWVIVASYFSYTPSISEVDFGMSHKSYISKLPVLSFNLVLKNRMVNPLITFVIPLLIIALLCYLSLIQEKDDRKIVTLRTLSYSASLLFILAILHIALRNNILSFEITFAEYCYIMMYFMVTLVTVNNLLLAKKLPIKWIRYRNNLLPRILYWPLITGFILLLAVLLF